MGVMILWIKGMISPEMTSNGVLKTDKKISIQQVIALENVLSDTQSESDFSFGIVLNFQRDVYQTFCNINIEMK